MREVTVQGLTWCTHHGRPIVALQPKHTDWKFWITLRPEDAQAMAVTPDPMHRGSSDVYQLLEAINLWLNVEVTEIWLSLEPETSSIQAQARFQQTPDRTLNLRLQTTEAIVLAWRNVCPIRTDDETLAYIERALTDSHHIELVDDPGEPAINPFRQFIESLDIDIDAGP